MNFPLRVFISHKVKEQGPAALEFVNLLRLYGDSGRLEIFLSPEIEAGKAWSAEIHERLRNAHILILLYFNPTAETNWCLYETGFFAAATESNPERKLICLVPKGERIPSPLRSWQCIELTIEGIKKLLKVIYKTPGCEVKPELFEDGMAVALQELILKALKALGPGEAVKSLSQCVRITIPPVPVVGGATESIIEMLRHGDFPEGTTIAGETEAFRQFGIDSKEGIPFNELHKRMEYGGAIAYFQPILTQAMADILECKAGPFPLPAIRVMKTGPARTLVFSNLIRKPSGELIFEFVVSEPPATATFGNDDSFSILYRLLALSLHFRRRVINQYERDLLNLCHDIGSKYYAEELQRLLNKIQFDINTVILDSMNRGILSRGQLIEAFTAQSEAAKTIANIIGPGDGIWERAMTIFQTAVQTSDIHKAVEGLMEMKKLNKRMIQITSHRLAEMVDDLE